MIEVMCSVVEHQHCLTHHCSYVWKLSAYKSSVKLRTLGKWEWGIYGLEGGAAMATISGGICSKINWSSGEFPFPPLDEHRLQFLLSFTKSWVQISTVGLVMNIITAL